MKNNRILILLILLLQGLCFAGFAQSGLGTNSCNGGDPNPIIPPTPTPDTISIDSASIRVEQPVDPNEIIGLDGFNAPESTDTLRWVSATQTLAYTVYFENDADFATAAASKVTVNVPLHPKFNYATLGIGSFGFGSHIFAVEGSPASYQTRIDLRDSLGIFVDVVAGLDIVHNEAFWIFQSIDPATGLPPTDINMGFLPINDSLHSGEGFVTFSIKPQISDCLTGDTVTATASIVFDVNEAIPTNTWLHTIDAFPPTSTLHMVPNGADLLTATFSGEDDEGGCGIKQFKLYCSQNEGSYQLYAIYPVGTSPQIPLETGIEYRFFVLAEDNVGNCEPMKNQPEFTIGTNFVTLAVNSFPAEAGSTTGAGTYSVNETAELTATAAEGYHFVHWMQQGAVVSTQDPYSLSVTQNQTYTAYFERDAYTLQTEAAEGSAITVTDIYGNEIPSGSTIYHSDRLIVSTDTLSCYQMTSCLLNGNTYAPGDTLTINGDVQIVTQTLSNHDYTEFSEEVCESYTWNGITYIQSSDYTHLFTNAAGCDSVVTLHLIVNHATYGDTTAIACSSFTWHDNTYTQSGNYTDTVTNALGCDSVIMLHLIINHGDYVEVSVDTCGTEFFWEVSGQSYDHSGIYYFFSNNANNCQDTTALFLSLHKPTVTELAAQICEGDIYSQNGFNVSEAGDYEQHLHTIFGCDSMVILHLNVDSETVTNIAASICEGEDYTDNGFAIIAPAVGPSEYRDTIHRQGTCDSIVVLLLTVNQPTYGDTIVVACDSFDWYEHMGITQSCENLMHTFTNAAGCDSIVTLHLTVNYTTYGDTNAIVCDSFDWYEHTGITQSCENLTHTFTNAAGCDSIVTLHLTVNYPTYGDTTAIVCDSFDWYEHTGITQSCENLTHTFTNAVGCDSIVTLHLTVNYPTYGDTAAIACDSFDWYEHTGITQSCENLTHTFTNAAGCDSIVTLHLTVNYTTYGDTTAIACDSFDWYEYTGITQSSENLTHTFTNAAGCDSIVTLHLTVNYTTYGDTTAIVCNSFDWYEHTGITQSCDNLTHTFTNAASCDSIVTLRLTVNYTTYGDTTATVCDSFDWYEHTGITQSSENLTHTFTNAAGCDSIVTLRLTVNYTTYGDTTAIVCDSFDWYEHTGITQSCDNLTHTFTNAAGCDSIVTLHLIVNYTTYGDTTAIACDSFDWYEHTGITQSCDNLTHTFTNAAGCDSIVTLRLTVNYTTYGDTTATVCDSFDWYEHTGITQSCDNLTHTFTNAAGCDSIVTLHLTVNHTTYGDTTAIVCDSFDWYEHTGLTQSCENLTHTFTNAAGCDSIVTLHLTVNYTTYGDTNAIACDSFDWYEHTGVTQSCENLTHTFTNAAGCDSIVTLHLTINHTTYGDTTAIVCDSFDWYEHTGLTQSCKNLTHTFTNAAGCDSIVTLHLTVNHTTYGDTNAIACDSFDWYEHTGITQSCDNLTHTFTNVAGCDSIVTLHLTVNHTTYGDTTAVVCDSFDWYEHTGITQSCENLTHTFTNAAGCDSIVTLHLTVNHTTYGDTTAIVCDSFDWYEHTGITQSCDNLTHNFTNAAGCDSIVTLHLTINNTTYGDTTAIVCDSFDWYEHTGLTQSCENLTHTFTNAAGCDSIVTLHLTVNHTTYGDTTAIVCDSFDWYEHTGLTQSCDNLTHTFTNAAGCDSIVTLHLTVNHTTYGDTTAIVCDSFDWYEHTGITQSCENLTHTFTNAAGCDSIVTLHLTVNYTTYGDTTAIVCDSFDWYEHTGITHSCENLTHTFTNAAGCDSIVTLHITVNYTAYGDTTAIACDSFDWYEHTGITQSCENLTHTFVNAAGCDSIVTLHLTVNYTTYGDTAAIACDSFDWYEHTGITQSCENLTHTFTNAAGCDSIVTLHLTINHTTYGDTTAIACDSFDWYEHTGIMQSCDNLTHIFTNAAGCDSIVTLHLTVNHTTYGDTVAIACDSFDWYEHTGITQSCENLTHTFINTAGCDSIVTLHLTINHTTYGDTTAIACDSFDWYEHTDITQSCENLTHTFTNAAGCDSIVTLHLTVNHTTYGDTTAVVCDSFDWYEHTGITQSCENLTHTFTNAAGCDSIVILHLTVNHTTYGDTTAVVCDSFDWYEHTGITQSCDNLTHTFTNAAGCDSIVTLHLTINHTTYGDTTAIACDSFDWYEHTGITHSCDNLTHTFTNAAGCDSVVTLHLTVNPSVSIEAYLTISEDDLPYTYGDTTFMPGTVQSGDYTFYFTTADGCDSIINLHLTVETGINNYDLNAFMKAYPNPTTGMLNVELNLNSEQIGGVAIQLYDVYGKLLDVIETHCSASIQTVKIDLSRYAQGVYLVKAVNEGKTIAVRKVVRN